jgi:hypothetical protein
MMHGFLDNAGTFTTLDPTGSTATTINGINDLGTVVGFYVNAPAIRSARWGHPRRRLHLSQGLSRCSPPDCSAFGVAYRRRKSA